MKLEVIRHDCGTQSRAAINSEAVSEYAERMLDGDKFPPAVVYFDGNEYYLADGFHRILAATRNRFLDFECEVRKGTRSDALKHSLGANALHGLKRTNADKRHSVELALAEWPNMSDRAIADVCAVGYSLVADVRKKQVPESGTCQPEARVGKDGKQYPAKRGAVVPATAPEFAESDETNPRPISLLEAQIETNEEEFAEIVSRQLNGIKEGVLYHMELCCADARLVMDNIREGMLIADDLLAVAVEFRMAIKLLEALAQKLGASSRT